MTEPWQRKLARKAKSEKSPTRLGDGRPLEQAVVWVPGYGGPKPPGNGEFGVVETAQVERDNGALMELREAVERKPVTECRFALSKPCRFVETDLGGLQAALGELADQLYRLHDRMERLVDQKHLQREDLTALRDALAAELREAIQSRHGERPRKDVTEVVEAINGIQAKVRRESDRIVGTIQIAVALVLLWGAAIAVALHLAGL
jgi:hypothetical protein